MQPRIFKLMGACAGYRQNARVLDCAHSTVLNQARRLGRHCLLYQHVQAPPGPPTESLVLDGMRTFEYTQHWPMDLHIRHRAANHERETIAFSKRAQNALLRMAVFQVERNFVRGARVRDGKRSPSPAMKAGIMTRRVDVDEVLAVRFSPIHVRLPEDLQETYRKQVEPRRIANPRRHALRYAT